MRVYIDLVWFLFILVIICLMLLVRNISLVCCEAVHKVVCCVNLFAVSCRRRDMLNSSCIIMSLVRLEKAISL